MQAQVKKENLPAYQYGYKHNFNSYKEVLMNTLTGDDYEECMYYIVQSFMLSGHVLVNDDDLFTHLDYFIQNPKEYLLTD